MGTIIPKISEIRYTKSGGQKGAMDALISIGVPITVGVLAWIFLQDPVIKIIVTFVAAIWLLKKLG